MEKEKQVADAPEPPERFRETYAHSYRYRLQQHEEMEAYLISRIERSSEARSRFFSPDYGDIDSYARSLGEFRAEFRTQIGMPADDAALSEDESAGRACFELLGKDTGISGLSRSYYRTIIPVTEDLTVYGIYIRPGDGTEDASLSDLPLVVACHGGDGCPEAICGLDTREPYHDFGAEAADRGYAVWAPFILMTVSYGGDEIRKNDRYFYDRLAQPIGLRIVGIEVYKIIYGLRSILALCPEIDRSRIAVAGLSYGGYFSLCTCAVVPEIAACVSSGILRDVDAAESTIERLGSSSSDRVFKNSFNTFDMVNIAGMVCPRPLLIQDGEHDRVVPVEGARRAGGRIAHFYENLGISDRFCFHAHDGAHEFENRTIFRFLDEHLPRSGGQDANGEKQTPER